MKKIPYGKNLNNFLIIDKYALQPYLSPYSGRTIKKKISNFFDNWSTPTC